MLKAKISSEFSAPYIKDHVPKYELPNYESNLDNNVQCDDEFQDSDDDIYF